MNLKSVLKMVFVMLLIIAFFMIFPAVIAAYYREYHEMKAFIITVILMTLISGFILLIFRKEKRDTLST